MARHQLIEFLGLFSLGIIWGGSQKKLNVKNLPWGISILIFISFSMIFWMIPRSVDLAVIQPNFNKIMNVHILLCGVLVLPVLRNTIFEVQLVFIGMTAAVLIASGIALKSFDILLCSTFDIPQQKETGGYMLLLGLALFIFNVVFLFFKLSKGRLEVKS